MHQVHCFKSLPPPPLSDEITRPGFGPWEPAWPRPPSSSPLEVGMLPVDSLGENVFPLHISILSCSSAPSRITDHDYKISFLKARRKRFKGGLLQKDHEGTSRSQKELTQTTHARSLSNGAYHSSLRTLRYSALDASPVWRGQAQNPSGGTVHPQF